MGPSEQHANCLSWKHEIGHIACKWRLFCLGLEASALSGRTHIISGDSNRTPMQNCYGSAVSKPLTMLCNISLRLEAIRKDIIIDLDFSCWIFSAHFHINHLWFNKERVIGYWFCLLINIVSSVSDSQLCFAPPPPLAFFAWMSISSIHLWNLYGLLSNDLFIVIGGHSNNTVLK